MKKLTDYERGFLEGLIDGEGSMTLCYNGRMDKFRRIQISVSSTSPSLVKKVMDLTGVGSISQKKKYKANHKQSYVWNLKGNAQCVALCEQLLPFLREETKWKRARKIVREWKLVTVRNGKYSEKQMERKIAFEKEFFAL